MQLWSHTFLSLYRTALLRSGKDKRSRAFTLRISFTFVLLAVYLATAARVVLAFLKDSGVFAGVEVLLCAIVAPFILGFLLKPGRSAPQPLAIFGEQPGVMQASAAARAMLEERALILSSMVARAASELTLKQKAPPPGVFAVARQRQNGFLRERNLRSKLEPREAELAGAPDAEWTLAECGLVTAWSEQLRVLRWVLAIDRELRPLLLFPKPGARQALDLQENREFSRKRLRSIREIRAEGEAASNYAARLALELQARGMANPQDAEAAATLRRQVIGDSRDFLAGSKTVGDLTNPELVVFLCVAAERRQYTSYLIDLLLGERLFSFAEWRAVQAISPEAERARMVN